MGWLSEEAETELVTKTLKAVERFLKNHDRPKPRLLGLMSSQQVRQELEVSAMTLGKWEKMGLKRYEPPFEDGRKAFYKVADVLAFLGVDE